MNMLITIMDGSANRTNFTFLNMLLFLKLEKNDDEAKKSTTHLHILLLICL